MNACNTCPRGTTCSGRMVCYCLQITEEVLVEALQTLELRTLADVRHATGAGDGCTACQRKIRQLLEQRGQEDAQLLAQSASSASASPI